MKDSFEETIDLYLTECKHLGGNDPVAYGLKQTAKALDKKYSTGAYAEYLRTIRYIETHRPVDDEEDKEDDLLSP